MGRLDGKVAVITGGNSGVGAATAKLFAKEGATVVITARREAALKEVADEITAAGGEVYAVSTDISKPEDPEALDPDMIGAMMNHSDIKAPSCTAEDVANVIIFFASDEAKAITGQIIVTDYGAML